MISVVDTKIAATRPFTIKGIPGYDADTESWDSEVSVRQRLTKAMPHFLEEAGLQPVGDGKPTFMISIYDPRFGAPVDAPRSYPFDVNLTVLAVSLRVPAQVARRTDPRRTFFLEY